MENVMMSYLFCEKTYWFLIPVHHQGEGTFGWSVVDGKDEAFRSPVTLLRDRRQRRSPGTCCVSCIVFAHQESDFTERRRGQRGPGAT